MKLDVRNWLVRLFGLFILSDLSLIIFHILYINGILKNASLSIELEKGYGEMFQYLKEYWIFILLLFLAIYGRSLLYFSWSLLFFYLLLDDYFELHENLGEQISLQLGLSEMFNLRARDFGELIVSGSIAIFFLIFIGIAYRFGDRLSRQASKYFIIMLFALAFFGIVVDMLHMAVQIPFLQPVFVVLEDGGELLAMSTILSFVFLLCESLLWGAKSLKI